MRRRLSHLLISSAAFGVCVAVGASADAPSTSPDRIVQLIDALADDRFEVREEAYQELLKLGKQAAEPLRAALKSEDVEQRFRAEHLLREIESQQLWEPSLLTHRASQAPVLDVFRLVADRSGNPVNWKRTPKDFDRTVSVDWNNVTYWKAMDELSRQANVVPRFYDDPRLTGVVLTHGSVHQGPISYAGPFRLTLLYTRHSLSQLYHYGEEALDRQESLEVTSALHWEQRRALCRYSRPYIVSAVTDGGEELKLKQEMRPGKMHVSRRQRQLLFTNRLKTPTKAYKRLDKLVLSTRFTLAGDFTTLTLDSLTPGVETVGDGYRFELIDAVKGARDTQLTVLWTRPVRYDKMNATDMADEFLEVLDESGNPILYNQRRVEGNDRAVQYVLSVPQKAGRPVSLRYQAAQLRSERTIDFTFHNVSLPRPEL